MITLLIFVQVVSPLIIVHLGYLFVVPIIAGLIDYYLIKRGMEVKRYAKSKTILLSIGITLVAALTAFYTTGSLSISSVKLDFLVILILLTFLQISIKIFIYKKLIILKKEDLLKMSKIVASEILIINIFFSSLIMMMI